MALDIYLLTTKMEVNKQVVKSNTIKYTAEVMDQKYVSDFVKLWFDTNSCANNPRVNNPIIGKEITEDHMLYTVAIDNIPTEDNSTYDYRYSIRAQKICKAYGDLNRMWIVVRTQKNIKNDGTEVFEDVIGWHFNKRAAESVIIKENNEVYEKYKDYNGLVTHPLVRSANNVDETELKFPKETLVITYSIIELDVNQPDFLKENAPKRSWFSRLFNKK